MTISIHIKFLAILPLCLVVSGCAVKTLKAPCSRDEGDVHFLSYAPETKISQIPFDRAFNKTSLALGNEDCGPSRPVNREGDLQ